MGGGQAVTPVYALGVLLWLGAVLAAPAAAASPAAAPPTSAPAPGYQVLPWKAGAKVPALEGRDLQGRVWRLSDLRGRAVLLNFWASWCEPCRAEMPSLQALAAQHPERLVVLAVNLKESEPTITRFVQRTGLDLPVLRDADGAIARAWGVSVYPSTVLLDPQGRVVSTVRGEVDWMGAHGQALASALWR